MRLLYISLLCVASFSCEKTVEGRANDCGNDITIRFRLEADPPNNDCYQQYTLYELDNEVYYLKEVRGRLCDGITQAFTCKDELHCTFDPYDENDCDDYWRANAKELRLLGYSD